MPSDPSPRFTWLLCRMGKIIRVHENCSHFTRSTFRGCFVGARRIRSFTWVASRVLAFIGCISRFFHRIRRNGETWFLKVMYGSAVASAEEIWGCNLLTEHCPWECNACASSFLSTEATLRKSAPSHGKMCFLHRNLTGSKLSASLLINNHFMDNEHVYMEVLSLKRPSNSEYKGQQEKCR